ncbi:MAG: 50S ribosomal protein L22 [Myxococcota bacterium]|jgi:large subunit ribosomal protein L22|nr:50S ribosomal protein L22 [Myxococcota bacterium]MEC9439782.1 50S ribosomal protein L22 [Myxococcota bacterium]
MGKQSKNEHRANQATLRMVRIAPRKVRLVIDLIRGKSVDEALNILQFTQKRAAPLVSKLIESALSNIENSEQLDWDADDLVVAKAYANEGPTLRRFKPRAQGRATRINKRTSHITIVLEQRQ